VLARGSGTLSGASYSPDTKGVGPESVPDPPYIPVSPQVPHLPPHTPTSPQAPHPRMTPTVRRKLEALAERHEEVGLLLAQPDVAADGARFRKLSREYAQLEPVVTVLHAHQSTTSELNDARGMLDEPELGELAAADVARLETRLAELDEELKILLLPKDPRDGANLFLEVRAGSGGDEAAIFAGDLMRMYLRYAEQHGWRTEIESAHSGEHGGYKEA